LDWCDALFAAQYAKSLGMITLLNPSPSAAQFIDNLDYIDLMIVNMAEARQMLKQAGNIEQGRENEDLALSLKKMYHCGSVIITLGADGYIFLNDEQQFSEQALKFIKPVDTSGAGDGFLAALTASLVWGKTWNDACHFANLYSNITITKRGTIPGYLYLNNVKEIIADLENGYFNGQ
jgi:ribokinase